MPHVSPAIMHVMADVSRVLLARFSDLIVGVMPLAEIQIIIVQAEVAAEVIASVVLPVRFLGQTVIATPRVEVPQRIVLPVHVVMEIVFPVLMVKSLVTIVCAIPLVEPVTVIAGKDPRA